MQWTDRIRQVKIVLVIAAVVIAVVSLLVSHLLVKDLQREERNKMQTWAEALQALKRGKKVLFSPKTATIKGLEGKFLPVFWSPVHFPKQAGTMGLLCHPNHPALRDFPTDMHSDWQWWNLVKRSRVVVLDSLPPVSPIVESIDNFVNNRRLALVFEAQVGKGKLIFSAVDLLTDGQLPEIRQMRYSLTNYMLGHEFQPKTKLEPAQLRNFLQDGTDEQKTDATSIYE